MESDTASGLVLAVDGGGSKTAALVAHRDRAGGWQVLGRGSAGPSNPSALGYTAASLAVAQAAAAARAEAALSAGPIERGVIALAGTLREDIRQGMQREVETLALAREVRVVPDLLPVLYAASPEGVGIGLIAGTGSVAFARDAAGRLVVAGGWGYLLGDEGSGFWLGREALRGLLTSLTGQASLGSLAEAVCHELGATTIDEVKRSVYGSPDPRQRIARLAQVVVEQAEGSSPSAEAVELLDRCAQELAQLVQQVAPRAMTEHEPVTIAATGGLLTGSAILWARLESHLARSAAKGKLVLVRDPLEGCLALCRDPAFAQPLVVD